MAQFSGEGDKLQCIFQMPLPNAVKYVHAMAFSRGGYIDNGGLSGLGFSC
jgi:hypothetical protein